MKNVLFATTALIATAGFASAEVSLSGSAELGIKGGDQGIVHVAGQNNDTHEADQFHNDIDITFTMSGESDNGITFGATIDADEFANGFGADGNTSHSAFISGDFGTLTMGDTDGALDKAVAGNDLIGDISDASTTYSFVDAGIDGALDGQVARYDYSVAGFGLSLSAETDDTGVDRSTWGFGATYTLALGGSDVKLGAGYQGGEDQEQWGLSVGTAVAGVDLVANYVEGRANTIGASDAVTASYGFGAVYTMDALSVGLMYGESHTDMDGALGTTTSGVGVAANYDLGGGLVLKAGYGEGSSETVGFDSVTNAYSLGLAMSF